MTATQPEGLDMTDEQILAHFEMPGLNLEATLDAHDLGLLLVGIRTLLSASKPAAKMGDYVKLFRPATGDTFKALRTDSAGIADLLREGWEIAAAPAQSGEPAAAQQGAWVNDPPRMPWEGARNEDERAAVNFYAGNPSAALFDLLHSSRRAPCQCSACKDGAIHASDCAVHNAPALPVGECNCGAAAPAQSGEPVDYDRVVSICDAHGIGLPVDCIEMVVEIIRHAATQSSRTAVVLDDERAALPDEVRHALTHAIGGWRGAACGTRDDEEGERRSADYRRRAQVIEDWLAASPQPVAQPVAQREDVLKQAAALCDQLAEEFPDGAARLCAKTLRRFNEQLDKKETRQ